MKDLIRKLPLVKESRLIRNRYGMSKKRHGYVLDGVDEYGHKVFRHPTKKKTRGRVFTHAK